MKQVIKNELPKMYLGGRTEFRTALRKHCLRNESFDREIVKNFIFDLKCPLGIPRGREEIEMYVRFLLSEPSEEEIEDMQLNFNNYMADIIYEEFRNEVNVKKFSKYNKRKKR